ncbi:hypothetical protein [Alkalinema sp. FACHB-956]|uniref:arginine synthesis PII-interacting regulator PirA n=1 Tax=Alkalinema sp. FACHB-956 TaxID=2692768 RepID=UPI00168285AE|nr:hypothetical protein [Alkalinema sp. FACHB-956]MBD2329114.1 hypothetical protein [Alkalinema sp. FACHB-956]
MVDQNRQSIAQVKAAHRENLRRNLQQRMEAARTRGDQQLLKLLEQEASYLQ